MGEEHVVWHKRRNTILGSFWHLCFEAVGTGLYTACAGTQGYRVRTWALVACSNNFLCHILSHSVRNFIFSFSLGKKKKMPNWFERCECIAQERMVFCGLLERMCF